MALQQVAVNYLSVLFAAIASMILGFLWYGPLFGKAWVKLSGISKKDIGKAKKEGMGRKYFFEFLTALIMAYVLAHFANYVQATTITDAFALGFWAWLGFIATVQLGIVLWEGRTFKLYLLKAGYY